VDGTELEACLGDALAFAEPSSRRRAANMGWWEENDGAVTVGDDPLDFLLDAFEQVVEIYRETMNRSPTLPEWQSLLEGSLFPYIEETSGEQVVVRIERYERSSS